MGQRSQIYIRYLDREGRSMLIAKYYQWNYGERIISRARYGIEYIKRQFEYLCLDSVAKSIDKIFNVNFDMQDILETTDIIQEWVIYGKNWQKNFKEYVFFNQDNNDGKLFIDIDDRNKKVKYCFTDYDMKMFKSPKEYMDWDFEDWLNSKYLDKEDREKCIENIEEIEKNATLMTQQELDDFLNDDYSNCIELKKQEINNKIKYLKGGE